MALFVEVIDQIFSSLVLDRRREAFCGMERIKTPDRGFAEMAVPEESRLDDKAGAFGQP